MNLTEKVKQYIREHHLIQSGDRIVTGVSGGADSVCLLCVLLELREVWNYELLVVHVNHGLRGAEADRDEAYVEELCRKYHVPIRQYHLDVHEIAKKRKQSEEEAGRDERRRVMEEVMRQWSGTKIAFAHHADDNVETMLFRLFRGTGIRGLGGMSPENGDYIRPLLDVTRKEIEAYLTEKGISYCVDSTNLSLDYTRNKLRNRLIPYIEEEMNTQAMAHMSETMEQLRQVEAYLGRETSLAFGQVVRETERGVQINQRRYEQLDPVIGTRVIKRAIGIVAEREQDIGKVHIDQVESLFKKQVGRSMDLPYHVAARRTYEGIELQKPSGEMHDKDEGKCQEWELKIPGQTEISKEYQIKCRVFDNQEGLAIPEKPYTKWFDYDIIKNGLVARYRRSGDRIGISKDGSSQKLKQFFVNQKVKQEERDQMLLIAEGSQILWVLGMRMSSRYQIRKYTKRILEIQIKQ